MSSGVCTKGMQSHSGLLLKAWSDSETVATDQNILGVLE